MASDTPSETHPATIRNRNIEVVLSRHGHTLCGQALTNCATGFNWAAPGASMGPYLSENGAIPTEIEFAGHFSLTGQRQQQTAQGVDILLMEWTRADDLKLDWMLTSSPEVSVLEYRAVLRNTGQTSLPAIPHFGPLATFLRGDRKLNVHWVSRDDFLKHDIVLDEAFQLTGGGWNRPEASGWIVVEDAESYETLFMRIECEGGWRIRLERQGSAVALHCTQEGPVRDLLPQEERTSPRLFLGVASRGHRRRAPQEA